MGGKVAQIAAARRVSGLAGLVLVAPAPPTPMPVPEAQRSAMLASYQTREGVLQALAVLAGPRLSETLREQVIADTLRGTPDAKRAWTERGMIEDISPGLVGVTVPVSVVVGDRDQAEQEAGLRQVMSTLLPQAMFTTLRGIGHLSPLEAPAELAAACLSLLRRT